ncbi:MAG: hypothetical protein PHG05_03420 [Candidatus Nanoarchaeia archaeon]|nr:hypothetical protein [Candidatus Nanoarchaeia archaeon]
MSKLGKIIKYGIAMGLAFKMGSCYGEYRAVKEYRMREQSNVVGALLDNSNKLELKLKDYDIVKRS